MRVLLLGLFHTLTWSILKLILSTIIWAGMEVCPQCCNSLNTANCRLVQDACGHKKCRLCLVLEEDGCVTCAKTGKSNKDVEDFAASGSNFDDSSYQIDNDNEIKFELFNGFVNSENEKSKKTEVSDTAKFGNDSQDDKEISNKTETKKCKKKLIVIGSHIAVLPGNPVRYKCSACNKSFGAKYNVKYHNYCASEKKPYQCVICKKGFVTKSHYEYHLRVHSGSQPFVCDNCGKGFKQKAKLTQHLKCHTGERSFICQQCGRSFPDASGLQCHMRTHTGEKPHVCSTCSRAFSEASNYKKHLLTHTGVRSFMCEECGKSFALKRSLDRHLFIHSRERNHVCENCNRGFAMKKDLKRHMIVHSNDRPHSCSVCGMKFRRKDNLERHVKNTHLEASAGTEKQQHQQITTLPSEPAPLKEVQVTNNVELNTPIDPKVLPQPTIQSPPQTAQREETCVQVAPAKTTKDNTLPASDVEVTQSFANSNSVESQPREYFRAVPVINRPSNLTSSLSSSVNVNDISKTFIRENPEAALREKPLFEEGKNCVPTITRASSCGKTLSQEMQSVIKPKLECFRILERPETFKPPEPPKISQPSLRMLLNDVECSDNSGTVLNLTQDVHNSRTDSLFQDSLGILETSKYDRSMGKGFSDSNLPEMYPSDFLLPSCDINRATYSKRVYYSEDMSSQYRLGSVSYDQFMGSPYLVGDVGSSPNNPGPYFRTDEDVSGRLKLLADVAGTKDPSVQVSQVIVGTKKHINNVINTNLNF